MFFLCSRQVHTPLGKCRIQSSPLSRGLGQGAATAAVVAAVGN